MSLDIYAGDRILMLGHSLVSGNIAGTDVKFYQPFADSLRAAYATPATPAATGGLSTRDTGCPVLINSGHAGDNVSDVVMATRCYPFNPDGVITMLGINDVTNGVTQINYTNAWQALASGVMTAANYARKKAPRWHVAVGIMGVGEKWSPGSSANGANDAICATYDGIQGSNAVTYNYTWLQLRPAMFALEATINAGNASTGFLTTDGRHLLPAGATFICNLLFPLFTLHATQAP